MHPMHLLLSVIFGDSNEIAPEGHFFAHNPQQLHADPAFGTIADPDFLYGLFPGTEMLSHFSVAFLNMSSPKERS